MSETMLKHLTLFIAALHLVAGCSILQTTIDPVSKQSSLQIQRTAITQEKLGEPPEVDTLIKLDNN